MSGVATGGRLFPGAATGRDALVASAIRWGAFFAVALAATVATAAPVWSTETYDPTAWTPVSFNLLSGADSVKDLKIRYEHDSSDSLGTLTDGVVPLGSGSSNFEYKKAVVIISGSAAWTFPKADIEQIRVFTRWADGGRDGVNISSVEVRYYGSEEWTDIGASAVSYGNGNNASCGSLSAFLQDQNGAALATGVTGLRLSFNNTQDNSASGYAEIEALPVVYCYYKSGVFKEGSDDLVVVDSDGNVIDELQSGDNVMFDDSVAGANATVYFGETLPTGVNYYFSDNWTGTVLPEQTDGMCVWTGANGNNNMNTAGNWKDNMKPSIGAAVYIPAKTVTINNDIENFAPASIMFGPGSGQVSITGNAIAGVAAITNLSSAVQTFNAEVSGTAIDFYNSSTHCAFRGGITLGSATFSGANTEAARALAGAWTFTGGDESYKWTPVENNRVMDNSSVTVEGELRDAVNLSIDAGCVVTAATLRATGNAKSAITKTNNGSLVVTGECRIDASADCYLASPADESKENSATVEFDSYIANNSGGWPRINAKDIIVGAGGISNLVANGVVVLAGSPVLHSRTGKFSIDQSFHTANSSNTTTIDTTQYGTEDVPAEVTINARFCKRTGSSTYSGGAMKVTGCGTLLFNSDSDFTGGLTVTDTATVAVNPGMKPGAGTVTVNNGATLQVAQSGTVALAGGLTLADGANLGFNFTEKQTAPVLNVSNKTVTRNGTIMVKVSAADDVRPKGGSYVLTSGGKFADAPVSLAADAPNWADTVSVNADGNIVLDVKSPGFVLIVK